VEAIGPFQIRREIASGSGGLVYEAVDPTRGLVAAVKLYLGAGHQSPAAGRLRRDARAAGALGHPNLAAVLGTGQFRDHTWVATELVEGVSLSQVIRSRASWPIERILDVWRQLCEGLAHAHREGLLHLDLKPADVRVSPAGEVKILDFGAWHLKSLERQGSGPPDEALHYRAPEMVAGERPERRADIFSVAAIVYELVARRKAFPGESAADVVRAVSRCEPDLATLPTTPFSPGLEKMLARGLARKLEERYSSLEEMHADLTELVRETVPRMSPRPAPAPGWSLPADRERLLAALTAARAEDRLEDALDTCRTLLALDPDDDFTRQSFSEIESILQNREVDELVGTALACAADGDLELAMRIAEKVERVAPWSPRYLQLQVYLDEEGARRAANELVEAGREHVAAGRTAEARRAAEEALAALPGHPPALRLLGELRPGGAGPAPHAPSGPAPASPRADPGRTEADALAARALAHFVANENERARETVEHALRVDPKNRRALDLQKILRVLG
jgi:serine/threonine protein kinase